jgi:hypothetical protein
MWEKLMMDPRPVKRDMLVGLVGLRVPEMELDFTSARQIAEGGSREALANPLLLAWFDPTFRAWLYGCCGPFVAVG